MKLNRMLLFTLVLALVTVTPVLAQDDVPTLRYFSWEPAQTGAFDSEQELADQCGAEGGYTVELESIGTPDFFDRVEALAAADDLPDVFGVGSGTIDEWAAEGLLLDITEYIERDIMPIADQYYSGPLELARYPKPDGAFYAFPYAVIHTVLWYNQDAFDAAGIEYPDPETGWTWDEFLAAAEALTVDEDGDGEIDQWGFWLWRGRYAQIEGWVYQNNGDLLNDSKTRFAPDENALAALDFLTSLITEHEVAPPPSEFEGLRMQDVFPLGHAAMFVDGNWQMNNVRSIHADDPDAAFRFAAAPIPRGPQWEEDTTFGWADMFGIAATTEHPDEAWHLVQCLTGPARTLEYQFAGKIPVYRPTAESEEWLELDQLPPNKSFLLEWAENPIQASFTPGWSEWRGYTDGEGLEGQIWAVQEGDITLDEAIENTLARANQVLSRIYPDS